HEDGNKRGDRIDWRAQTPYGSKIRFQLRTAANQADLQRTVWSGPEGPGSFYFHSGAALSTPPGHSWIQFRADFDLPAGTEPAVLEKVTISFE
ncbi:MAG: hypothetical protein Q8P46_13840, partial [Hyphomicrobiales bacterium]|nr:hypothetical protein [Hyphomicrobiales bacterium]